MTSNVNFDARTILQLFVIALYVCGQSTTEEENNKMVMHLRMCFKSYLENYFRKSVLPFAKDIDK